MEGMNSASITMTTPQRHLEGLKTSMEETTGVDIARRLFCWEGSAENRLRVPILEAETLLIFAENCGRQTQTQHAF